MFLFQVEGEKFAVSPEQPTFDPFLSKRIQAGASHGPRASAEHSDISGKFAHKSGKISS